MEGPDCNLQPLQLFTRHSLFGMDNNSKNTLKFFLSEDNFKVSNYIDAKVHIFCILSNSAEVI